MIYDSFDRAAIQLEAFAAVDDMFDEHSRRGSRQSQPASYTLTLLCRPCICMGGYQLLTALRGGWDMW